MPVVCSHTSVIGRFAPSPTGEMHLGNVFAALLSWLSAKHRGGEWRLRIEDLDPQRSRPEYAEQIMRDLEWLGLTWDGDVLYQSHRTDIYHQYLRQLQEYTYPCTCTRNEILAAQAPHETDGRVVYPGTCRFRRGTTPDERFATRLIVQDEVIRFDDGLYGSQAVNLASHCGDFILRRSDGVFAYQLAVVVDDALSGVTEVVRGRDLLLSAAQQIYLYRKLQLTPPAYCHHPLLVNEHGQRLCKRDHALELRAMRSNYSAQQIIGMLAFAAGLLPEVQPVTPQQLLSCFSWTKVPTQDITIRIN